MPHVKRPSFSSLITLVLVNFRLHAYPRNGYIKKEMPMCVSVIVKKCKLDVSNSKEGSY